MKKPLLHLAQHAFNRPLLITKSKFDAIMAGIGPRLGIDAEDFVLDQSAEVSIERPKASYQGAKWSDFGDYAVTDNGTAIIPVHGTLVRRADWIDAMSGLRSYESIRADFNAALNDKYVSRILLDCDSGGGEVSDCFDLADMIYASRSIKPSYAFANDYAFSAMYAIASSAQRVAVTRVGGVGSIGVICVHCDQSEFDKKLGVKYTAIYSGSHKNDFTAHEPLSKDVQADGQREIDRLDGMFDVLVARNRGLSVDQVDAMEAALYYGEEGVAAGLADQVATFDELLAQIDLPSATQVAVAGNKRLAASAAMPAEEAIQAIPAPKGEAMPIEPKAAAADETMPEECQQQEEEPDPENPAEQEETKEEEKEIMEAKPENTGAAPVNDESKSAAKIARMCSVAGYPELAADFIGRELTFDAALEELDKARLEKQPKISSARRPVGNSNAMAEIESQARAQAGVGGTTKAKAFRDALFANPNAYAQYLRDNPQLDGGKTAAKFEAFGQ